MVINRIFIDDLLILIIVLVVFINVFIIIEMFVSCEKVYGFFFVV